MQKKAFVLYVFIAVALCAMRFSAPAAADDVPAVPTPRPAPVLPLPRTFAALDSLIDAAVTKANPEIASAPSTTTATPARAQTVARAYPRAFSTYDALTDYAISVAKGRQALNDQLGAVLVNEDAARATLATVFDPRQRGGLLKSRDDLIDDGTMQSLETLVANDVIAARRLVADGAVVVTPASWRLPLLGEDTQDFGPTPYYYEPPLTYGGVSYNHFHTGTDIATAWGTPVLAPAHGVVVFAGTMSDGAEVVVLAHDSGLVSMYAHLDNRVFRVPVKAGDTVEAGDRIGSVGLTGITTGAHLHWSVWRDGDLIDPLSMIRA